MTVIIQAKDIGDTPPKHKEVTGTYIPEDGEFALDVWIKGVQGGTIVVHADIDAPESAPLNVQPLEELVSEDIVTATVNTNPVTTLTRSQIDSMFDKALTTGYKLTSGRTLSLNLKKPFRLSRLKLVDTDGLFIGSENLDIMFYRGDGGLMEFKDAASPIPGTSYIQPFEIHDEIVKIDIYNVSQNDLYIYEIIGELYFDREITNPERRPANVKEIGELVSEDITSIYSVDGETYRARDTIELLFDKLPTTYIVPAINGGDEWIITLKKPFRVKEIKILNSRNQLSDMVLVKSVTLADGTVVALDCNSAVVNDEIISFTIENTYDGTQSISEIIAETFLDERVFAPESAPLNTQPLETLVSEDVYNAELTFDGIALAISRADINKMLDKNKSTLYTLVAVQKLTLEAPNGHSYTDAVPTDIGKTVYSDANAIGPLLYYNNTTKIWYVASEAVIPDNTDITISTGTGAGYADGDSVPVDSAAKFYLKTPFRIKYLYAVDDNLQYLDNAAADVTQTVYYPNNTSATFSSMPAKIDREIIAFSVNNNTGNDIDIAEVMAELFMDRRMFLQAESIGANGGEPFVANIQNELVLTDIRSATLDAVPVAVSTLENMFDKDIDSVYSIAGNSELDMFLKKSYNVKQIKLLDADGELINIDTAGLDIEVTYVDGQVITFTTGTIFVLDDEIIQINIINTNEAAAVVISELIGELYNQQSVFQEPIRYYFTQDDGDHALTDAFVGYAFIDNDTDVPFKSISFDLSNDDDTGYIEWSWDGTHVDGILYKGETFHEVATRTTIYLRGQSGGEAYRVWARGQAQYLTPVI